MTFSKVRQGALVINAIKKQIRFHPFRRFEHPEQWTLLRTQEAGLVLFSFLLAVPVWAQDKVAPDPDAATPPGKRGAFRPSLVATLFFGGLGRGKNTLEEKGISFDFFYITDLQGTDGRTATIQGGMARIRGDHRHQFRQDQRSFSTFDALLGGTSLGSEKAFALNYAFQRTPYWLVQPTFQYHTNIGGNHIISGYARFWLLDKS